MYLPLFTCIASSIKSKWKNFCIDFVFLCYYFNTVATEHDIKCSGFNPYCKKYTLVF